MSKYDPLRTFLENAVPGLLELTLSFQRIESTLGSAFRVFVNWKGDHLMRGLRRSVKVCRPLGVASMLKETRDDGRRHTAQ